jgi:hypothetical protein
LTFLRAGMDSAHDEILPEWLEKGVLRRTIRSIARERERSGRPANAGTGVGR